MRQTTRFSLRHGAVAVLATTLLAAGCGTPVAKITVSPAKAPPAAPIVLKGFKVASTNRDGIAVMLGDEPTLFNYQDDGTIVAVVPAFMESSSWPVVPAKPVTVKVFRHGTVIAVSTKPFQVLPLEKAPGTTAQMAKDLDAIAASYDATTKLFMPPNSKDMSVNQAFSAVLHSLGTTGADSLQSFVDGTTPLLGGKQPNLDLVDAVMASSGYADYLKALSDGLAEFRSQALLKPVECKNAGAPDFDLACYFQYRTWLLNLAYQVVHATAEKAEGLAKVAGILGIIFEGADVPLAILKLLDLFYYKLSPQLMPSKFDSFKLQLQHSVIPPDAWTSPVFTITGTNEPSKLSMSDLLEFAESVMSVVTAEDSALKDLGDVPGLGWLVRQIGRSVKDNQTVIQNTVNYAMEQLVPLLPDTIWDGKRLRMPKLYWGPVQVRPTSVELLTLRSSDDGVVTSVEHSAKRLDWNGEAPGEADIWAQPRGPGETSQVYKPVLYPPNYAGAFGGNGSNSNWMKVIVVNGEIHATVANHGTYDIVGTSGPTDGTGTSPNDVEGSFGSGRGEWWFLGTGADHSQIGFSCGTPFTKLGVPFALDGQNCGGGWMDNVLSTTWYGGTTSGTLSFDTCRVLEALQGQPFKVLLTGSFASTMEVQNMLNGNKEQDEFDGTFSTILVPKLVNNQVDPAEIQAIEDQCAGWPP